MLLSVFTPSHDPTYLPEVWECLKAQTLKTWEWVVVANGDHSDQVYDRVVELAKGDPRVVIVEAPPDVFGVGALKRFACLSCTGDVFVEYDHDDLITPDCLEAVLAAAIANPLSFIYSDDVTCGFDGTSHVFSKDFGWRNHVWEYQGRKYTVNETYPITPRSMCDILFAPDHIRAWTRRGYDLAGGHDATLEIGDDHELMVRSYLAGLEFVHIPRPLYVHRLANTTTSQKNLTKIAQTSANTRNQHLHALVVEWCNRNKLPVLDLGGAHGSPQGFIPVDQSLEKTALGDLLTLASAGTFPKILGGNVFDILSYVPENSVGCFRASDFLEHIPIGKVIPLMNLLYEKLVPGGYLLTHTPAVCDDEGRCGRGAYQDPDHKSFWSSNNVWYFTDRNFAKYENGAITCRFQTIRVGNYYPSDWHKIHLIPYVLWDAMALKDDDKHYYPGPRSI